LKRWKAMAKYRVVKWTFPKSTERITMHNQALKSIPARSLPNKRLVTSFTQYIIGDFLERR